MRRLNTHVGPSDAAGLPLGLPTPASKTEGRAGLKKRGEGGVRPNQRSIWSTVGAPTRTP